MKQPGIRAALQSGPDCPSLAILVRRMELPAGALERRAAEDHVYLCAHCRTELALLNEFESGEVRAAEKEAVEWIAARLASAASPEKTSQLSWLSTPRLLRLVGQVGNLRRVANPLADLCKRPSSAGYQPARRMPSCPTTSADSHGIRRVSISWWQRLWTPPGLAAALAVAAALIIGVNVESRRPALVPSTDVDVLRSAPLRAIGPVGDLGAAPEEFRWTAVADAAAYVLTVTEVDRTVVFRGKVAATSTPIPAEVRSLLHPGKTLVWTVSAEDASGRELASSSMQRFRLEFSTSK